MKAEDLKGRFRLVNIVETPYEIDGNKGIAVKVAFTQGKETFECKCKKELAEKIVKDRSLYDTYLYQLVEVSLDITTHAEKVSERAKATALAPVKVMK